MENLPFTAEAERSEAKLLEQELRSQEEELAQAVENLPTHRGSYLSKLKKFLAVSLPLLAVGCEREVNSAQAQEDFSDKNRIVMKTEESPSEEKIPLPEWLMMYVTIEGRDGSYYINHGGAKYKLTADAVRELSGIREKTNNGGDPSKTYKQELKNIVEYVENKLEKTNGKAPIARRAEVVESKVPDPAKWLGLPVQERDGNYFVEVRGGTYKLTSSDMSQLHKFKTGHDEANEVRRQINKKFDDEKLEKLKDAKPVERKGIWAPGSTVDQQTRDNLAEQDKKAYAQNLERHEKDLAELEAKKAKDEDYIGRMTKLAIEEEIQRLGERQ